MQLTTI